MILLFFAIPFAAVIMHISNKELPYLFSLILILQIKMYRLVTSSVQYIFSVYEIALSVSWADPLPTTLITQVIDLELNYCITSANHDKYV